MAKFNDYPKMAHIAKLFGGPKSFIAILVSTGLLVGGAVGSFVTYQVIKKKYSSKIPMDLKKEIKTEKEINRLLEENKDPQILFNVDDEIEVLEDRGDILLVKRKGESNDSYYISKEMFKNMTNKKEE